MQAPGLTPRRSTAFRDLAAALAAFAAANALALLLAGPPSGVTAGPVGRLVQGTPEFATPLDEAKAHARGRLQRIFVYLSFNVIAAALLGFAVLARLLERIRREKLGLPEGLDEGAITPRMIGLGGKPPAGSEYRPSLN